MRVDIVLRGMDHAVMAECAKAADTAGEHPLTLWLPESPGDRNVFATAAALLARSERTRVGTGVVPIPLRPTIDLLAAAITVGEAFPGRFDFGVGSGNVRSLAAAGVEVALTPLAVAGGLLEGVAGLRARSGVAALIDVPATVEPPPVYLAAHNRKMIELAVRRADGAILNVVAATDLPQTMDHVRTCAERAGTTPAVGLFQLATFGPPDEAIRAARRVLAGFLRSPTVQRRLRSFESRHVAVADRISDLSPKPTDHELAAAMSDEVVLDFAVISEDMLRDRVQLASRHGLAFVAQSVFPVPLRLRKPFPPVPEQNSAREATMNAIRLAGQLDLD